MRQSTRLVLNATATYVRMFATVGMGIYAARLQLHALGQVDNGIFEAIGIASFVLFVTDALTLSAERHLAHAIGKGDDAELRKVFNTSLVLFALAAVCIVLLALACAPFLDRVLVIPAERVWAAKWSFVLVSLAMGASILTTPFRAMFVARQEMFITTIFELGRGLHTVLSAMLLFVVGSDRLVMFSLLTMAGNLLLMSMISISSIRRFPESRPHPELFSRSWLGHIAHFMLWATIGSASWQFLLQGSVYVLNQYFGPVMNTTFGLARRVANYQGSLTQAIARAADPAIVSIEARGDRANVHRLVLVVSKYQAMMSLFYMVPVFLELPFLLRLWLRDVPPETLEMSRYIMLWMWMGTWTQGHASAVQATGDVAGYGVAAIAINILSLVVPWTCFALMPGARHAYWLPMGMFVVRAATNPLLAWYLGTKIKLTLWDWFRNVALRAVMVAGLAFAPCALLAHFLSEGWLRLISVTLLADAVLLPVIWLIGLGRSEKTHFTRILSTVRTRILGPPRVHIEPQPPGQNLP